MGVGMPGEAPRESLLIACALNDNAAKRPEFLRYSAG